MTAEELKAWRMSRPGRKRKGKTHSAMSQAEAAAFLDVPPGTYRRWEQGVSPCPDGLREKIDAKEDRSKRLRRALKLLNEIEAECPPTLLDKIEEVRALIQ